MKKRTKRFKPFRTVFLIVALLAFLSGLPGCGGDSDDDAGPDDAQNSDETPVLTAWYQDNDDDGYGNSAFSIQAESQPAGYIADNTDCDDTNADIHPGATDICGDGIDNDCSGEDTLCSVTWYKDSDGDGYSDGNFLSSDTQPAGHFNASDLIALSGDCNDAAADIHPGASENCADGIDNDCSGQTDCADSACSADASCAVSETLTYPIPDTGQTNCYGTTSESITCPSPGETYYGQDAQYAHLPPNYTDNSDDTITDNVTGLMWQKNFKQVVWADAAADAASDTTAGYTDWRVPTIKELYTLIDFSGATGTGDPSSATAPSDAVPYIDTDYFEFEYPSTGRFIDAQYISSTEYTSTVMIDTDFGEQEVFFGLNLADGRIKGYPKSIDTGRNEYYARWVRGSTDYGRNDFTDNGDDTITDQATGLRWMKVDSGDFGFADELAGYAYSDGSLDWVEALDFCESLTFAGRSDWRLPNAHELQSIVDYSRSPDATGSAAIDPVFDVTQITVEDDTMNYPFYWTGTTHKDGPDYFAVYLAFGEAFGHIKDDSGEYFLSDVHGAGAQRSSLKTGDPEDIEIGRGPQGDVIRIYNYVRCVTQE